MSPGGWPPPAEALYRDHSVHTPVWQGDVFEKIPIYLPPKPGGTAPRKESRTVIVLAFPCDMYSRAGELSETIPVAVVKDAETRQNHWRGLYDICPLEDLRHDGAVAAVQFAFVFTVEGAELTPQRRVRALSEYGIAHFQQRIVVNRSRLVINIDRLKTMSEVPYYELLSWEKWNSIGGNPAAFQGWLDQPDPAYMGRRPRTLLDERRIEELHDLIGRELEARTSQ